jgi:hypothetical protein
MEFPPYDSDGIEELPFENLWRGDFPQTVEGAECSVPFVSLNDTENLVILKLTALEITEILSALYAGAEMTYPTKYLQVIWNFLKGIHCPPELQEESDCLNYPNYAPFISYLPLNPFNEPDEIPDGYASPPFLINSDLDYPESFGYAETDVFVPFTAITIAPENILTVNYPTVKISVFGSGQIELDLLSVQQGGYAVLKVGSPPNILDILGEIAIETGVKVIDLDTDSLSIPPETDVVIAEEINIEALAGVQTDVYIVFIPKLNDSLLPLGFGGGIRTIGLCGFENEATTMGIEDIRFNPETCTFEKRVLGVWEDIENGDDWLLCVEASMATQEEITEAVVDAAEIISSRFLSGQEANLLSDTKISKAFEITLDNPVTADDPSTLLDEASASKAGGVIAIARGINQVLADLLLYFGADATPDMTYADAEYLMLAQYLVDTPAFTDALSNYWIAKAAGTTTINSLTVADVAGLLYCRGITKQTVGAYIADAVGVPVATKKLASDLIFGLSMAQFDAWYAKGSESPSTDYLSYTCIPIASYEFTLQDAVTFNDTHVLKKYHRYEAIAEGYKVDSVGNDVQDAWWISVAGASPVFDASLWNIQIGSAVKIKPTVFEVPYNGSHKYIWTIDMGSADASPQWTWNRHASLASGTTTSPSGGLLVKVRDLGEYLT